MAEALWSLRPPKQPPTGDAVADGNPVTQRRLAEAIAAKLAAGYELQSQTATEATLSKPRRRCLGVTVPGRSTREVISIERGGRLTTRAVSGAAR
jgi:hypothetical protein